MTHKKILFILTMWLLFGFGLMAQDAPLVVRLSLADVYALADTASSAIRAAAASHESAREATTSARLSRLPDIELSLSASYIGDGWLADRDYTDGRRIDMPHWGNSLGVEVSQVLYAGGAITASVAMARLGEQIAALDVERQRQEVRLLLAGHYLDLYRLHNQLRVIDQNVELTRHVLRQMEARHAEGTALQNDITRYELQLQTLLLQRVRVQSALKKCSFELASTLHLPIDASIEPDTTVILADDPSFALSEAPEVAADANLDVAQAELSQRLLEQAVEVQRAGRRPKIALVAQDHMDGPILIEVPTIDKNFNYWFVGLGVSYDLASLYKGGAKIRRAKADALRAAETARLTHENIATAIESARVDLLTAHVEVETQQKSVQLAVENYDVTARRYDNDLALLTDMLDASSAKLSAELALVNARIGLAYSRCKLLYLAGAL